MKQRHMCHCLIGTHIFPSERCLTALAIDVRDGMQPSQQHPLLGRPAAHVNPAEIEPHSLTLQK